MEKLMTVEELAEMLNYTPPTVRRWVLNGEIPFHKIQGGIRFRPSEIEKWVNDKKSPSLPTAKKSGKVICSLKPVPGRVKQAKRAIPQPGKTEGSGYDGYGQSHRRSEGGGTAV